MGVLVLLNPLPADSFSKYKTKVLPNKVCISDFTVYTINYTVYFESFDPFSAEILQVIMLTISAYYLN